MLTLFEARKVAGSATYKQNEQYDILLSFKVQVCLFSSFSSENQSELVYLVSDDPSLSIPKLHNAPLIFWLYIILHSEAQTFSCRSKKKNTFLTGGRLFFSFIFIVFTAVLFLLGHVKMRSVKKGWFQRLQTQCTELNKPWRYMAYCRVINQPFNILMWVWISLWTRQQGVAFQKGLITTSTRQ